MAPSAKNVFDRNPPYRPVEKKGHSAKWQKKNAEDQYPKLIFDLEDQYLLLLEDQYPKSILKRPSETVVKGGSNSAQNSVFHMGLHRVGAQGVQSTMGHSGERTGECTVHVLPNFFAFHARKEIW